MTQKTPQSPILRLDAFEIDLARYTEDERMEKLKPVLRNRIYTVGKTDINYRVINHWERKNLLPDGFVNALGGWRKFSLIETVWLRVMDHLRGFGLSLERIALVKEAVMQWDKKEDAYLPFEYYYFRAFTSNADPYVAVWSNGAADIATSRELENAKRTTGSGDVLLISLKSIIREMGHKPASPEILYSLSRGEKELIHKSRFQNNKEVKARFKDGDISEVETLEVYSEAPSLETINKDLRDTNAFAEVITRYSEGKKQSAEVRKRQRIK